MNEDYQKLDEDIMSLTGSPEWQDSFMKILQAEAAAALQNQLEAHDWDEVMFQRGYHKALEFVANIRAVTQVLIEQAEAGNADV